MEMSNASVACSQIPVLLGDEGLIKKIRKSFCFCHLIAQAQTENY